ncbi:hypothetical protein WMY93_023200 [Mugilogobius chulae]|uniref:Sodium/potassium/calcium exchanger 1 n=1 Tax=Mugilogobius chulae TaxID=88201 RepID=A0AAW0N837_9GOBI
MKWKPVCFLLYAMFLCVSGAGPNEVITENPNKSPDEDDTSIQELHPPSAETTAQTTRETNFLRDLDVDTQVEESTTTPTTEAPKPKEKFPQDVFSLEERRKGWVGCSSWTKPGIDTIMTSAVFNILLVIGMCALFSREMLHLSWWPFFRDVSFYLLNLIMLIIFFLDSVILWYESLILLGGYSLYLVFMKYNVQIEWLARGLLHRHRGTVIAMNEHGKETGGDGSDEASRNHNGSHKDVRHSNSQQEEAAESRVEVGEESQPLSLKWPGTRCGGWCTCCGCLLCSLCGSLCPTSANRNPESLL